MATCRTPSATPEKHAPVPAAVAASRAHLVAISPLQQRQPRDWASSSKKVSSVTLWIKVISLTGIIAYVYKVLILKESAYPTMLSNRDTGLRIRINPADQETGLGSLLPRDSSDSRHHEQRTRKIVRDYGSGAVDVHNVSSVCSDTVWQPLTSTVTSNAHFPAAEGMLKADIVVAHCTEDLSWLQQSVASLRRCPAGGVDVVKIYIYSKCGIPVTGMPPHAVLTVLPNVGRNDHTFAHHLSVRHPNGQQPLTLFIKDTYHTNRRSGKEREVLGLCQLVTVARQNGMGFGCGMAPRMFEYSGELYRGVGPYGELKRDLPTKYNALPMVKLDYSAGREVKSSAWHIPSMLGEFAIDNYTSYTDTEQHSGIPFNSPVRPLREWAKHSRVIPAWAVDRIFDRKLVPVCYGGQFAVLKENLERIGLGGFANLRHALTRGDNIEEGHFAERLWAAILTSKPLWPEFERIEKRLISLGGIVHQEPCNGMLVDCIPWPEEPKYRRRRRKTRKLASLGNSS